MPSKNKNEEFIDKLSTDISDSVGNIREDELRSISDDFETSLINALKDYRSSAFDNEGFIKKMGDLNIDGQNSDMIKTVLNNLQADYLNPDIINQNELLLRRDIKNICCQMPEMKDVINITRDAIIECDVSTGSVSRTVKFENHQDQENLKSEVEDIEKTHKLHKAIKNYIIPRTLESGEFYVQITPYSKLFAEIEAIRTNATKNISSISKKHSTVFKESIPNDISSYYTEEVINLNSEENLKSLMESVSDITKSDNLDIAMIDNAGSDKGSKYSQEKTNIVQNDISYLLKNIDVHKGSSPMMTEMGGEAFKDLILSEYIRERKYENGNFNKEQHFSEAMTNNFGKIDSSIFGKIDQNFIDTSSYSNIKGCYIKYLNSLRMVPIRLDRRICGYLYATTTMDLQNNSANPNGIIDLSFQNYTRDRNMVDKLARIIINAFDKEFLKNNIKLKNEIADIIMAHKFSEGRLSFVFIPEDEIVRFVVNEDEDGRGHSIIEPSLFPARMYLMLNMYNMLYVLNNNQTRIHYVKSSGLNKNYAAQVQRTIRKFQSRRINIDDIYSYSGVLNKIGGSGEWVLPAGRNDYKAIETDTLEPANVPINVEFLEQQRRQAISGSGVPALLVINAIDEVDFAKTLEMANTRFLSTVSSYKIDFNEGITELYKRIMRYDTSIEESDINSFLFMFNSVKNQELNITNDMIQNFNSLVELVANMYYKKSEIEDDNGPTAKMLLLRKSLAAKYLPIDIDELDEIIAQVDLDFKDSQLSDKAAKMNVDNEDLEEVEK